LVCAAFAAAPVAALNCLPSDVATSYREAEASEAGFYIVLGRLDFDPDDLARLPVENGIPERQVVEARFAGGVFTGCDFGFETRWDVTIEALCFAP